MKGLFKRFSKGNEPVQPHSDPPIQAERAPQEPFSISDSDVFRYRKQRGVNLGSWFVLERWICESLYLQAAAPAQSDLDVAKGRNAKEILEKHWDTWIKESDWDWLAERGINTVRIPIGYYHVCGADRSILDGTDFYPFYSVYEGAWARITKAILSASKRNIGVIIDLHAAPGKQNRDSHSGTSNTPNFFNDPHNQRRGLYALQSLASNLYTFSTSRKPPLHNIIGIELLNEPDPPSDQVLQTFYTQAIDTVQKAFPTLPIYLGECWRPDTYAEYLTKQAPSIRSMLVLDHHLYRCFTPQDIQTSVEDHIRELKSSAAQTFDRVSEKVGRAGGGIIVGEWSGGLNPGSLRGKPNEQRDFVRTELELFEQHCDGWFFWTYKKEFEGDTGWSLRDSIKAGFFPPSVGLIRKDHSAGRMELQRTQALPQAKKKAYDRHVKYWSQFPGNYEHWRFADGFEDGWNDAYRFLETDAAATKAVSEIGFKRAWATRRTSYRGPYYWEYEHGFVQGSDEAKAYFASCYCEDA